MANEVRLIDANALMEKADWHEEYNEITGEEIAFKYVLASYIEEAPTVDAVPVVHGRWIRHGCYSATGKRLWEYTCSECKTLGSPQWKCCPVCTARMDGDGNA